MHSLFSKASGLTHDVIGSAIEVHKDKGPGLLESIDEWCLTMEGGSTRLRDEESGQCDRSIQAISSRIPASL